MSRTARDTASTAVLDLAGSLTLGPARGRQGRSPAEAITSATGEMLGAATARGETHVVLVSSAIVYGAWDNNPVPLEETRTLRPHPDLPEAVALAAAEAMVDGWRRDGAGRTATILRPVTVVRADSANPMVDALARAIALTPSHAPGPAQFLDRGDLDAAVELCVRTRPDGVFNVAPPGMIPGERLRELAPASFRIPVPGSIAEAVEGWRGAVAVGPGALSHARNPWVVSAARLESLGWSATVANEQAYVAGTSEGWFASLNAKRRQELALGAAAVATVLVGGVLLSGWRRARRR